MKYPALPRALAFLVVATVFAALVQPSPAAGTEPTSLVALREAHQKALERDTGSLRETYLKELHKLKAAFEQSGDLDSSLAVDGEIKGTPVPNTVLPLAKLKDQYIFARNRVEAALKPIYEQELVKMKGEFTRSENLDAAQAVAAELKRVSANEPSTVKPGGTEKPRSFSGGSAAAVLTTDAGRASLGTVKMPKTTWKNLKAGTLCTTDSDKYMWDNVPRELEGLRVTLFTKHAETLAFEVEKPGLIFIATSTRWQKSGDGGGGKEALTEKGLEEKGWKHLTEFDSLSRTDTGGPWMVFCKPCNAGETCSIRTEKYASPVVLMR